MNFDGYEENFNLKNCRNAFITYLNEHNYNFNKLDKNGLQLNFNNKIIEIRFTNTDLYKYHFFKTTVKKNVFQINKNNYYQIYINPYHISWITTFLNEIYNLFA